MDSWQIDEKDIKILKLKISITQISSIYFFIIDNNITVTNRV